MSYSPPRKRSKTEYSHDRSDGTKEKPHISLVMGHSFARRLGEYAETTGRSNMEFSRAERVVHFYGVSGSKLSDFQMQMPDIIERLSPNCVTLQVAGNDLTSANVSPSHVVNLIKESSKLLRKLDVSLVIINKLFYREVDKVQKNGRNIRSDYNKVVDEVNDILQRWCKSQEGIKFKQYKGSSLFKKRTWKRYICHDGVHLNPEGMARYYKRIRKSIRKTKIVQK